SENQSRLSCQRGPSGKVKPSSSVSGIAGSFSAARRGGNGERRGDVAERNLKRGPHIQYGRHARGDRLPQRRAEFGGLRHADAVAAHGPSDRRMVEVLELRGERAGAVIDPAQGVVVEHDNG